MLMLLLGPMHTLFSVNTAINYLLFIRFLLPRFPLRRLHSREFSVAVCCSYRNVRSSTLHQFDVFAPFRSHRDINRVPARSQYPLTVPTATIRQHRPTLPTQFADDKIVAKFKAGTQLVSATDTASRRRSREIDLYD